MTVRINKQKINLREKLTEFEDKVNFDEVVRGLGEYTGNVGIGTTNPAARLNLKGDSSGISTSGEIFRIDTSDSDGCRLTFGVDSTNEFGWIRAVRPGSETDLILQGLGGAVGIGTTNPSGKFHVTGGLSYLQGISLFPASGNISEINSGSGSYGIQFKRGATNTMLINEGGSVGIGMTDLTDRKLSIYGAGWFEGYCGVQSKNPTRTSFGNGFFAIGNNKSNSRGETSFVWGKPYASSTFEIAMWDGTNYTKQFEIDANGATKNITGTISQISSDERLKENISDATPKLQDLLKLKVKNFNFSDDENKTKYIGFIAQEMEEVFPSLVITKDTREYDENGNLLSGLEDSKSTKVSMDFAILTKAIQEQQSIIEELKSRIETLESK